MNLHYQGFLAKYAPNTRKIFASSINHFLSFLIQNGLSFEDIDQNIINLYQSHTRNGVNPERFNSKCRTIRLFLKHLGYDYEFHFLSVLAYERSKLISQSTMNSILAYLWSEYKNDIQRPLKRRRLLRDYIFFNLLFLTGLRKSEVAKLRHGVSITFEYDQYYYSVELKGGRVIKKAFPEDMVSLIDELRLIEGKKVGDFIFTGAVSNNNKIDCCTPNSWLNRYCSAINKKEHVTVHSIRNLSGLAVFQITNDVFAAKEHFNHENIATTQLYLEAIKKRSVTPYSELKNLIMM